jgi:hypothetical protein
VDILVGVYFQALLKLSILILIIVLSNETELALLESNQ